MSQFSSPGAALSQDEMHVRAFDNASSWDERVNRELRLEWEANGGRVVRSMQSGGSVTIPNQSEEWMDVSIFTDATPRPLRFARSCVSTPFNNFDQESKERLESPVHSKRQVIFRKSPRPETESARPFDNFDQELKERPESSVRRKRQAIFMKSPRPCAQLEPPEEELPNLSAAPHSLVESARPMQEGQRTEGSGNLAPGDAAGGDYFFLENGGLLPPMPSAKSAAAKGDAERLENFHFLNAHHVLHVY
jgi:hypothetical protein